MPLRTRLFIIIAFALVAIAGVTGILYYLKNKSAAPETTPTVAVPQVIDSSNFVQPNQVKPTDIPAGATIKQATTLEMQQNAVKQLAKIFIERYNSFSSENNYQNIIDARELVTNELWARISQPLGKPATGSFIGVTTEAVNATLSNWGDAEADFLIKTRRTTEKDGAKSEQYQDVKVTLKKTGTAWLVDSFTVVSTK